MGFEYAPSWLDTGHAISSSLPLEQKVWLPEQQTAHRWFGNLLPEEQARTALLKRLAIPGDDFALLVAGMSECCWSRLQQQRHHIIRQCRRAAGW